jgi:hypothetical protein
LLLANAGRDLEEPDIHLWQNVNPVVTEALAQLTWGGPQVIYNGGIQQARLRYFDRDRGRAGLPADVAALVSSIRPGDTVVTLVNLSPVDTRRLVVQAGALAEHDIVMVTFTKSRTDWTGSDKEYIHHEPEISEQTMPVGGPWLDVDLPPSSQVRLTMRLDLHANPPSYRHPDEREITP